jgi:hypothetical protein
MGGGQCSLSAIALLGSLGHSTRAQLIFGLSAEVRGVQSVSEEMLGTNGSQCSERRKSDQEKIRLAVRVHHQHHTAQVKIGKDNLTAWRGSAPDLRSMTFIAPLRATPTASGRRAPRSINRGLIPSLSDQYPWAQSRRPMEVILQGWLTRVFQAKQQWSTMSA